MLVYNAKNKTRMENILLDQVLQQVRNREISIEKARELICVLFNVSKSVATEYAEFCVRCDRDKLPLLCLEDYIKQYCC